MERVNMADTLYTCMKIGHWNLLKSFQVAGRGIKVSDRGDQSNQGTL
jgi:hypothetical protein